MTQPWDKVEISLILDGMGWGEGPAYLPAAQGFVFSDIVADTIHLSRDGKVTPFRQPSHHANGNIVDPQGRLITCEHQTRRVTRTELDGSITTLADSFEGRRLNSPNDVVVGRDGSIWFTDPPYGILRGECGPDAREEQPSSSVFRVDGSTGAIERVITLLDKPNGLTFSADGRSLYVSDTGYSHRAGGNHHIFKFEMVDCRPNNLAVFATIEPGGCDGLRVDGDENVWSTAGDGIHCFNREGELIGRIALGEMTTNLCFLPEPGPMGVFVTTPTRALVCRLAADRQSVGFCHPARSVSSHGPASQLT